MCLNVCQTNGKTIWVYVLHDRPQNIIHEYSNTCKKVSEKTATKVKE